MDGKCIVIAAGQMGNPRLPIGKNDFVIAADGGLRYCGQLNIEPDLVIGDFDSVSGHDAETVARLKQQDPDRVICLPVEKDDTDMLAALKEGLRRGYSEFCIYAGTGGRFDHTFANIQCLLYLKNRGAAGYLADAAGMIFIIKNETVCFPKDKKGYLSLFSLVKESRGVFINGMKYPLENADISNDFPIGISNEFIGEDASITVKDGELVCILQNECREYNR